MTSPGLVVDAPPKRAAVLLCAALGGLSLSAEACGGAAYGRSGAAVPLSSGPPVNECERAEWYEVVPAFVRAGATTTAGFANTYYTKVYEGDGVFREQSNEPEDIEDLLPKMGDPELARRHHDLVEPVEAARRRTLYFSLGGLVGLGAGVGIYAGTKSDSPTVADVALGTGLAIGLLAAVGVLVSQPSARDQLLGNARCKLFINGEDEDALVQGVDHANSERRRHCGTPAAGTTSTGGS